MPYQTYGWQCLLHSSVSRVESSILFPFWYLSGMNSHSRGGRCKCEFCKPKWVNNFETTFERDASHNPPDLFLKLRIVGLGVANEVLIWGKKKNVEELRACGFIKWVKWLFSTKRQIQPIPSNSTSEIFASQSTPSFHASLRSHLLEEMRDLDPTAILVMKGLIKRGLYEKNDPDAVNLRESYGYVEYSFMFFGIIIILILSTHSPGRTFC